MRSLYSLTLPFFALCFTVAQPASAAREPVVLKPTSNWYVDFGEKRCRLSRVYGEGEDRHAIFFQQWQPSRGFAFTAAGPSFDRFTSQRKTMVRFEEGAEPRETTPFVGKSEGIGTAVIYTTLSVDEQPEADIEGSGFEELLEKSLPQLDIESAKSADQVSLRQRSREVVFQTGPLDEAFTVLNTCTQDLVKDWGLDAEKHLSATRMVAVEDLPKVVRKIQRRYPVGALNRGEQAILRVRVMVDANGTAVDCVINEVTQTKRLESPACRPLMEARYTPALDANGEPFASYYATSITYVIP
ncbi:MAG: energy transducer TonB [Pseudomonadota bacterium]